MNSRTNLFKRITALTIAGISAITITSCGKQLSPMETIEKAAEENFEKLENSEAVSAIEKFYNGGSLEIKGNLSEILALATGTPMDLDASFKMYSDIDAEPPASAVVANVGTGGTTLVDLAAYFTEEYLAVGSNSLLGEDAYGITYATFADKFANSIFGPDGEYPVGEEIAAYIEMLGNSSFDTAPYGNLETPITKLVDELKPTIYKSIEKNGKAEIVSGTVTIAGSEVNTNDVTMNFKAEDIVSLIKDVLTAVKDSKNLKPAIEAVYDTISYYNETESLPEASEEILEFSADGIYDMLIVFIDEALADLNEIDLTGEDSANVELSIVAHIANKTGELVSLSIDLETAVDFSTAVDIALATSFSPDWEISADVSQDGETAKVAVTYKVSANTDTKFESALSIATDGASVDVINTAWDKTTGDYEIAVTDPEYVDTSLKVNGKYVSDAKSKTISVTDITVEGETYDLGEISMIITYEDKMPTIEKFTDILDLTSADIEAIGTEIMGSLSSLGSLLG